MASPSSRKKKRSSKKKTRKKRVDPYARVNGRSILNRHLIEQFCLWIRRGMSADTVCDLLGIPDVRYYAWLRKGEQYLQDPTDEEVQRYRLHAMFVMMFKRANAEYQGKLVRRLHRPGAKDWYRCLSILERRNRRVWSRNDPEGGTDEDYDPNDSYL